MLKVLTALSALSDVGVGPGMDLGLGSGLGSESEWVFGLMLAWVFGCMLGWMLELVLVLGGCWSSHASRMRNQYITPSSTS